MVAARPVAAMAARRRMLAPFARRLTTGLPKVDAAALTDEDVARFNDDGAIVLRQVLSPAWVDALRAAAEENLRHPGPLCDEHAAAQGTGGE